MMKKYTFCDPNGRIIQYAECSEENAELTASFTGLIKYEGDYDNREYYLKDGVMVKKPILDVSYTDGILKGVPQGASIRIDNEQYESDGSNIELSFIHAGSYTIKIDLFPFKLVELTVTA